MIREDIKLQYDLHVPDYMEKEFQCSAGSVAVRVDTAGNYTVKVNGVTDSPQENSARRDPRFRQIVEEVSKSMVAAFYIHDRRYSCLAQDAREMLDADTMRKNMEMQRPERYRREELKLSRPSRAQIRRELEEEAEVRFADIFDEHRKERTDFVNEHERAVHFARLQAYEEVQEFFATLQDEKEARYNTEHFQPFIEAKHQLELCIDGNLRAVESKVAEVLRKMRLLFAATITCAYHPGAKHLDTVISLPEEPILPRTKCTLLASGRISVKDKLVKEIEQMRTDTMLSLLYYVAAEMFSISPAIRTHTVSLQLASKSQGLAAARFDREAFRQLNLKKIKPVDDLPNHPHVARIRQVRGADRLENIPAEEFNRELAEL